MLAEVDEISDVDASVSQNSIAVSRQKGISIEDFTLTFASFVRKEASKISRACARILGEGLEEVQDLYSVGMLELVSIYSRVDFDSLNWKGYVYSRIKGAMFNYLHKNIPVVESKKAAMFVCYADLEETLQTPEEDSMELELLLFRKDLLVLIREFMETLKPEEQLILALRFSEERSYSEIGQVLGHRRESIAHTINRIINKLCTYLYQKRSWKLEIGDMKEYFNESSIQEILGSFNRTCE